MNKFINLTLSMTIGLLLLSCGPRDKGSGADAAHRVYRLWWFNSKTHNYEFQNVSIPTLTHPLELRGEIAQIWVDPEIQLESDIKPGKDEVGIGHFIQNDNMWIPADDITLEAVTLYAHIERLMQMANQMGVHFKGNKPLVLILKPKAKLPQHDSNITDNAMYLPDSDSVWVFPYTGNGMPMAINGGVIAHEFFHRIFEHMVRSDLFVGNKNDRFLSEPVDSANFINEFIVLRGLDEGLADFWAYAYLSDGDFFDRSAGFWPEDRKVYPSIPEFVSYGDLSGHISHLFNKYIVSDKDILQALASSYKFGTVFARGLVGLSKRIDDDIKNNSIVINGTNGFYGAKRVAKMVIDVLPKLRSQILLYQQGKGKAFAVSPEGLDESRYSCSSRSAQANALLPSNIVFQLLRYHILDLSQKAYDIGPEFNLAPSCKE